MKIFFVFILLLMMCQCVNAEELNYSVYDFSGNKILTLTGLSIKYYSPNLIIVRDNTKKYYRVNKSGKPFDNKKFDFLSITADYTNCNFIPLVLADGRQIIYNKNGDVVVSFGYYEPLYFTYLKNGTIIGYEKGSEIPKLFEPNKKPRIITTEEKQILLNKHGFYGKDPLYIKCIKEEQCGITLADTNNFLVKPIYKDIFMSNFV